MEKTGEITNESAVPVTTAKKVEADKAGTGCGCSLKGCQLSKDAAEKKPAQILDNVYDKMANRFK